MLKSFWGARNYQSIDLYGSDRKAPVSDHAPAKRSLDCSAISPPTHQRQLLRRRLTCFARLRAQRHLEEDPIQARQLLQPLKGQLQIGGCQLSNLPSVAAAAQPPAGPGLLTGLFDAIRAGLEQQTASPRLQPASLAVNNLSYQPPGAEAPLLQNVSLYLPGGSMGLVYGRSGSGKTTLLQILAGLVQPSSGGSIAVAQGLRQGQPALTLSSSQLAAKVGLVFQFPERHFLGHTIYDELTFGWPSDPWQRQMAGTQLAGVLRAVDLEHVSVKTPLRQLSDGYKRRVALAVQLARRPSLLLLDEPLAGLDWQARADVAKVLGQVKQQCTVLMVSHDLTELLGLVDCAWRMEMGGFLMPTNWPPQ